MKNLIKISTFILFGIVIMSFRERSDDTAKLYLIALKEHILKINGDFESNGAKKEFSGKTIFIINDAGVDLLSVICKHKIQDLGDNAYKFVSKKNELHAIKLQPLGVDHGQLVVILSDYVVSKDGSEARFSYIGGMWYAFNYDSKHEQYSIVKRKIISF